MEQDPKPTTRRRSSKQNSPAEVMPAVEDVDGKGPNGRTPFPPGNSSVFLTDDDKRGGLQQPDFLQFITAHPEDKARLLAEARLTPDLEEIYIDALEDDQAEWGYVSTNSIATARVVVTIGRGGEARDEAVRVATSNQGMGSKAQGLWRTMFGARGGPPSSTTGAINNEPGY